MANPGASRRNGLKGNQKTGSRLFLLLGEVFGELGFLLVGPIEGLLLFLDVLLVFEVVDAHGPTRPESDLGRGFAGFRGAFFENAVNGGDVLFEFVPPLADGLEDVVEDLDEEAFDGDVA